MIVKFSEVCVGDTFSMMATTFDISLTLLKKTICITCDWHNVEAVSICISYKFANADGICKFVTIRSQRALSFALELSVVNWYVVFHVMRGVETTQKHYR